MVRRLVAKATKAIIASVLCSTTDRVGVDEFRRAALLIAEMVGPHASRECLLSAAGEMIRLDSDGIPLLVSAWHTPGSRLTTMIAKTEFTREDAIAQACYVGSWATLHTVGLDAVLQHISQDGTEFFDAFMPRHPFWSLEPVKKNAPPKRYLPLALHFLDLIRTPHDQPEIQPWMGCCIVCQGSPAVAVQMFEAGLVELAMAALSEYSPYGNLPQFYVWRTTYACVCTTQA